MDRGSHEAAVDSLNHDRADAMRPIYGAGVGTTETTGDIGTQVGTASWIGSVAGSDMATIPL